MAKDEDAKAAGGEEHEHEDVGERSTTPKEEPE